MPGLADLPPVLLVAGAAPGDSGLTGGDRIDNAAVLADGNGLGHPGSRAGQDGFVPHCVKGKPGIDPLQDLFGVLRILFHAGLHFWVDDHGLAAGRYRAQGADLPGSLKRGIGRIWAGGLPVFYGIGVDLILVEQVMGIIIPGFPVAGAGVKHMIFDSGIFGLEHLFQSGRLDGRGLSRMKPGGGGNHAAPISLYGSDGRTGGAPQIIAPGICACMNAIFCTGRIGLPCPCRKSLKAHGSGFLPAGTPFPCGLTVDFPASVICLYCVIHK